MNNSPKLNLLMMATQTILILAANPQGTTRLRLDQEVRDIQEGLRRSQQRDHFIIQSQWAVRPRDIQRAMLDHNPHIVHFAGHGDGEAGLIFEDEIGQPKFVSSDALASLFALFAEQLDCVVLNGCYSQVQAAAIAQHIPYVIGMNAAIGDQAAIEFAVGFYDALGAGRTVEFAYQMGCAAMQLAGSGEHQKPVLLKQPTSSSAPASQVTSSSPALSPPMTSDPIRIFFSYAHEDELLRNKLATHLKLMEREKLISAWYDRDITAGEDWNDEIERELNTAQVILLLISADFLASDFCWGREMTRAMERHAAKEARVIPIILREVDWHSAPFGKLQALPKHAEPVTNWSNLDQAFADVAKGIRRVVEQLKK